MKKQTLLLGVIVVILVVLGVWYFSSSPKPETLQDNSAAISADVNGIDLGDLESDFQDINADINSI